MCIIEIGNLPWLESGDFLSWKCSRPVLGMILSHLMALIYCWKMLCYAPMQEPLKNIERPQKIKKLFFGKTHFALGLSSLHAILVKLQRSTDFLTLVCFDDLGVHHSYRKWIIMSDSHPTAWMLNLWCIVFEIKSRRVMSMILAILIGMIWCWKKISYGLMQQSEANPWLL